MKLPYFNLKSIILYIFLLLFITACAPPGEEEEEETKGGNGVLKMTILSPYENVIGEFESSYYDGESSRVSKSTVTSRYKDYGGKYSSSSLGFSDEPFCRVGGNYRVKVSNENSHGNYNSNNLLYYCKTTADLINDIKIPTSWVNKELSLYCNDGNLINFQELNLDFLTTQVNHYKVCVLKNEELNEGNTIVYGFEVGNKEIDSNSKYNFNPDGGDFAYRVEGMQQINSIDGLTRNVVNSVAIPYVNWCSSCSTSGRSNSFEGATYFEGASLGCEVAPAPAAGSTCYELEEKSFSSQSFQDRSVDGDSGELIISTYYQNFWGARSEESNPVKGYRCKPYSCDMVTPKIESEFDSPDLSTLKILSQQGFKDSQGNFVSVNINGESVSGISWYSVDNVETYSIKEYQFEDNERIYYYSYDESDTYYYIKTTSEDLIVPITDIFSIPSDFDLSRVALFKVGKGNKKAYGFENPAKDKISGAQTSTEAIYTIDASEFGMNGNRCVSSLSSFDPEVKSVMSNGDTILCSQGKVFLNSRALDSVDGQGSALTLFKNIILNLE